MKTLDIIGVYSKADCYEKIAIDKNGRKHSNLFPVLYKQIASVVEQKEYDINHIYLFNSFNNIDAFEVCYRVIINSLEKNYPNYDFSKLKKITYINNNVEEVVSKDNQVVLYTKKNDESKQVTIDFYKEFFSYISKKSQSDVLYFNLQSGNVQSKEAMQIALSYGVKREILIYNESEKNTSRNRHDNDKEYYMFFKEPESLNEFLETSNIDDRISLKANLIDTAAEFHTEILKSFFENELFFEGYYHYLNYKDLYDINLNILNDYFGSNLKFNKHNKTEILKKDFASYYLRRLIYIYSSIESRNITKSTFEVTEKLLYSLFHLEQASYIERHEDKFIVRNTNDKQYEKCIDRYDSKFDNGKMFDETTIVNIKNDILKQFRTYYIYFRHDKNVKSKIEFTPKESKKIIENIFNELKNKFEKTYLKYVPSLFKGNNFDDCLKISLKIICSKVKINEKYVRKYCCDQIVEKKEKICILSMAGSTDPGNRNYKNENKLEPGSTLSVMLALNSEGHYSDATLNKLRKINKEETIPFYFILTKEIIDNLFLKTESNNDVFTINDLNKIYKSDINIVPFAKNENNKPLNIDNIILTNKKYNENELLNMISYSNDGYDIKLCLSYISKVMETLLKQYNHIYLIESSGLPNCKMALSFLYLLFPTKISVFQIKSPNINNNDNPIHDEKTGIDGCLIEKTKIIKPLSGSECILSRIKQYDENFAKLQMYLKQELLYDENEKFFKNENIKDLIDIIKEHDSKEIKDSSNEEIARILVKFKYLIEFGLNEEAYLLLDKPFETIFCAKLRDEFVNKNISFDDTDIDEEMEIKYNNVLKADHKMNNRRVGTLFMINFVYNYKNHTELKNCIKDICDAWELSGNIKHKSNESISIKVNNNLINEIIELDTCIEDSFNFRKKDECIKILYEKEIDYYNKIEKRFFNLKN